MIAKLTETFGILVFLLILRGGVWKASAASPGARAASGSITTDKVLESIRERFGVPDSTKMTASPLHDSADPAYYECTVTVDDGKGAKTQSVSVSKDGRFMAMGSLYPLGPDAKSSIIGNIRDVFKVPVSVQLTVGDFHDSAIPSFRETVITADGGKGKQTNVFYVTKDNRYVVMGGVFPLLNRTEMLRLISTADQPGVGPVHAPVTVVEYADLECPSCARMHEFLEKQLLPKYGDKVKLIFKEFPLINVHEWAAQAAVANECAYEIDPSAFVPYRSMIFQHQSNINGTNARDQLLTYGEALGVDRVKLAACMDSRTSQPRVDKGLHEGQALGVSSTPTFFINGKMLVGMAPPDTFYKAVDEALAAATTHPAQRAQKALGRKQ